MAAQLEKTFECDFLFQKNGRCGMGLGLGLGWDRIQSPVSSHLLKRKTEVYINLPPNYHCTLLQHRTKLRWKEINPHKKNWAWSPSLLLPSVTFFTFFFTFFTIPRSIHITKAPNLSWSSFPPLLPFPPSRFLHCCCRQLLYHQFSCNSCGLCQDMEHRLGAALRSGSSVLTAVISDNTALHIAIHTAIQVAEGHQLTTGARKLAGHRPANLF